MGRGQVTRRTVMKASGGLAAAAALGVAGIGVTRGQEASPVASPVTDGGLAGRWAAVRSRTVLADVAADEMIATIRDGYVPLIRAIPGFVAYLGIVDPNSTQSAFVTVFEDKAGADESTVQAGAWLQDNGYEWFEGEPHVVEGPIGIAAGSFSGEAGMATPAAGGLEGTYVAMRSRKLVDAAAAAALIEMIREGFVPLVSSVPGFVAYLVAANEETLDQFALGVFADEAGAAESTARAAEWGTQGAIELTPGDPVVFEGTIMLAEMSEGI